MSVESAIHGLQGSAGRLCPRRPHLDAIPAVINIDIGINEQTNSPKYLELTGEIVLEGVEKSSG
jgi:hypothetical protein